MKPHDQCPLGSDCDTCRWWVKLRGTNPQSGVEIDDENCAISWLPILLINVARETYSVGGAIESFRNETIKASDETQGIFLDLIQATQAPRIERARRQQAALSSDN